MRKISADYIFPITQPSIKDGIVLVDNDGTIIDLLNPAELDYSVEDVEKYKGIICPGFINTHCHLELSYLKGKIPPQTGLLDFVLKVDEINKTKPEDSTVIQAIEDAESEMIKNGIVAVGDISNTNISFAVKNKSKLKYHTFIEVYASNPKKADAVFEQALDLYHQIGNKNNASIVPHAPYSLSNDLFTKVAEFNHDKDDILTIHHKESDKEQMFPFNKSGKNQLSSISKYLPVNNHLQLVHNTFATKNDVDFAEEYFRNLWWCFCPNANLYIENRLPDFNLFTQKDARITIGTDSLASNHGLSIIDELKIVSEHLPDISLNELLKWGTLNGAEFLKIQGSYGSLEKGKQPGINLIEFIDTTALKLTPKSKIRVLL